MNKIVEIKDLSFAYDDKDVLKNINLSVYQGEFLALIGANGAGKSTLLKLLLSQHKANRGSITLFGYDISRNNHYKDIAYISQNAILGYKNFPTTVEELITIHLKEFKIKQNVGHFLKEIGLEKQAKHRLKELSGGQLQRVALSLALLKNAKLIILDEPTSGIDKNFSRELFKFLKKLSGEGKTIVMATHNLSTAMTYIDRIIHLVDGLCKILNNINVMGEMG